MSFFEAFFDRALPTDPGGAPDQSLDRLSLVENLSARCCGFNLKRSARDLSAIVTAPKD